MPLFLKILYQAKNITYLVIFFLIKYNLIINKIVFLFDLIVLVWLKIYFSITDMFSFSNFHIMFQISYFLLFLSRDVLLTTSGSYALCFKNSAAFFSHKWFGY